MHVGPSKLANKMLLLFITGLNKTLHALQNQFGLTCVCLFIDLITNKHVYGQLNKRLYKLNEIYFQVMFITIASTLL